MKFKTTAPKLALIRRKRELGAVFNGQVANLLPPQRESGRKNTAIFFRDHLTSYGMRLFAEAKEIQITAGLKYLWTKYGDILISEDEKKRPVRILNRLDILKLQAKYIKK